MGEANALGREVALSPVTWVDGWPYFGLPGNLGRTPRIWIKPDTGTIEKPRAPYVRSDDFSAPQLQPIWQWNHVPVDAKWSLTDRPGFLRLHAMPATSLWDARNTLTQRAVGPRSIPTVVMDASGLKSGDVAGLALFIQPDAWLGVERGDHGLVLVQHDGQTMIDQQIPLSVSRVWLRADCEFHTQLARFSYSTDGTSYKSVGDPFRMVGIGVTFQGVRYALFSFHRGQEQGGFADFDSFHLQEPNPHGITRPIPIGKQIEFATANGPREFRIAATGTSVIASPGASTKLLVVDGKLGRVSLKTAGGFLSVGADGDVSLHSGPPQEAETFQWIETLDGDLTLLSLKTNRYLRVDFDRGKLMADIPGPEPNGPPGARFDWH